MPKFFIAFSLALISSLSFAQLPDSHEMHKMIMEKDSLLFERGFNNCDMDQFEALLSEDFEFYHDISGIETSKANNIEQFKKGICGNPNFKSRRQLIAGTTKVYLLKNNGEIYGLLQQGIHQFYESLDGETEVAGNVAKFTHLWIKEGSAWRIRRVLSYDHKQPMETGELSAAAVDLGPFLGKYKAPKTGDVHISLKEENLFIQATGFQAPLQHKAEQRFEIPGSGLEFEFVSDKQKKVVKFQVIENGKMVEEAIKQ